MNAQRWIAVASLLVALIGGCNQAATSDEEDEDGATAAADEREFESADERRYALFADQFAAAVAQKDYPAAWKLGSSHLRSRTTAEQFAQTEQESLAKFGQPVKALPAGAVYSKREELLNPADVPDPVDRLIVVRAVGETPATVPVDLRRASVQVDILRDPKTVPGYTADDDAKTPPDEDEAPRSYLTVVLVEENGELGVAHYWHRWPDVLD